MSNSEPLVSVIIPVFRVEKYLEKGVNSITDQTYKNLQIILVDDGSDDNCPLMCDEYAKKDDRILALHKQNGGLSDARNYGLPYAEGKYIYFFDSDDYLEANAIEKLVEVAEKENADVVAFGYKKVDEAGNILENSYMKSGAYHFESEEDKLEFITKTLLAYKVGWEAWNRLYRAEIIRKNELRYEPNKEIFAEDRCFNIYYTLCTSNLTYIEDRYYHYLIRDDSIMGKTVVPKINENLNLMDYIKKFAAKKGLDRLVKGLPAVNIALFIPVMLKIPGDELKKYRSIWNCSDINERFARGLRRLLIFTDIYGIKNGWKNYRQFQKFISSNV